jgi:hypothetical protein
MTIPASGSTSKWGVSEIVVADCHHGPEGPGAPPLRAYRLMQTGNVARTTVDDGDSRFARRTENADIGSKTFADFAARLEKGAFSQKQDTRDDAAATDGGGERQKHSEIMSAILAAASDPRLSWKPAPRDNNVFSICTE